MGARCHSTPDENVDFVQVLQQQLRGGFHVPQPPAHILRLAKKGMTYDIVNDMSKSVTSVDICTLDWKSVLHSLRCFVNHLPMAQPSLMRGGDEVFAHGMEPRQCSRCWCDDHKNHKKHTMICTEVDIELASNWDGMTFQLQPHWWPSRHDQCTVLVGSRAQFWGHHAILLTRSWQGLRSFPTYILSSFQLGESCKLLLHTAMGVCGKSRVLAQCRNSWGNPY